MEVDPITEPSHDIEHAETAPAIRSSARVRAAKEKEQQLNQQLHETGGSGSNAGNKGKSRIIAAAAPRRRSTGAGLTINEPPHDPKGKKRAAPIDSDDEDQEPPRKKSKPTQKRKPRASTSAMSRKARSKSSKESMLNPESDVPMTRRAEDEDVQMQDGSSGPANEPTRPQNDDENHASSDVEEQPASDLPVPQLSSSGGPLTSAAQPQDQSFSASLSMLESGFHIGAYMSSSSLAPRLKTILTNLKPAANSTTRLLALQDLSEILSMSTEDNLSGYFSLDAFVKELVHIMGGARRNGGGEDDEGSDNGDNDDELPEQDEDAALAAALALSGGGMMSEENLEAQLLACRCLANLMEAMPGSAHTLVYHGAVPVLCSKLLEIQFIDLAEQTISTLQKLSEEYPSAIVREGGLAALLNYLDFFSTHVQRTALQAASNCCRNMSSDMFNMIRDVFPTIRNVLSYSDQRLVEYASMCVIRTIESFARNQTEGLEKLLDAGVVKAVMGLVVPSSTGGGAQVISNNTCTSFLRALTTAAKSSPIITLVLLEANVAEALYTFLTGVFPPEHERNDGMEEDGSGSSSGNVGLAELAVMQTLAHKPKDQVEEALGLICELMPPLPRDGVFDPKGYTEKAVARAIKAKLKEQKAASGSGSRKDKQKAATTIPVPPAAERARSGAPTPEPVTEVERPSADQAEATTSTAELVDENGEAALPMAGHEQGDVDMAAADQDDAPPPPPPPIPIATKPTPPRPDRLTVLRSNPEVMARFLHLIVPILFDVYAASVTLQVRLRSFTGILKACSWVQGEGEMGELFLNVPVASFIGSILSSRDNPLLVTHALQLVELLLLKAPTGFKNSLRKEGVLHEVSTIAKMELKIKSAPKPTPVPEPVSTLVPEPESELVADPDPEPAAVDEEVTPAASTPAPASMDGGSVPVPASEIEAPTLASPVDIESPATPAEGGNDAREDTPTPADPPVPVAVSNPLAVPMPLPIPTLLRKSNAPSPTPTPAPPSSSSIPSDAQDAFVLRARVIKVKYMSHSPGSSASAYDDPILESLAGVIKALADPEADIEKTRKTLKEITKMFGGGSGAISSFELLKSGLVDGLLEFATDSGRKVDIETREELIIDAFSVRSGYATPGSQTPLAILVKRLQESLTRMESFNVVSTSPGGYDDAKRSSMALISRTLRLKLVAEEGTDVPKSCQNLIASIHAIAPFSALSDYLKPRIAGLLSLRPDGIGLGGSNGLLQALGASGSSSSGVQGVLARLMGRPPPSASAGGSGALAQMLSGLVPPTNASVPGTSASGSGAATPSNAPSTTAAASTSGASSLSRRRSQRLKAQVPTSSNGEAASVDAPTASSSSITDAGSISNSDAERRSATPSASSEATARTAAANALAAQLFSHLTDEMDDDDDALDGNGVDDIGDEGAADRTVNLTVDAASGEVAVSTPGGTRVATPLAGTTPTIDSPIASAKQPPRSSGASNAQDKPSYASAAQAAIDKATDFHLEFRLDDEVIPMDMTIYGAFHQYEARKAAEQPQAQPLNPNVVWNGNY